MSRPPLPLSGRRRPRTGHRLTPGRAFLRSLERLEDRAMPSVITPFTPRFQTNDNGDVLFVANTMLTAPSTDANAAAAQAGTGTILNNNDFNMVHVDVDSDASTFDSSRADLKIPTNGSVLFAGLYWGGSSASAQRTGVLLQAPGATGYGPVTGALIGADSSNNYQGFADVTTLVRAAGSGTYTVANVQSDVGSNKEGGWSLVVVYRDPLEPARNLTVFDGLALVSTASTPDVTVGISGFQAPPTGAVNAHVGVIAYEGDRGFTGDSMKLDGALLSDPLNPSDNFFNATISRLGVAATAKNPNYVNQLGFDAKIVSANGIIPNGATSATITLHTALDAYLPGVVTTAFDLYAPILRVPKTVTDLTNPGGDTRPGDLLEYTLVVQNTGGEPARDVVLGDAIPANTTYVPGSLQATFGSGTLRTDTDAAGDDPAEYDSTGNRVVFRIGAGATGAAGGRLNIGDFGTVRFRVRVSGSVPNDTQIVNQAVIDYTGVNTGTGLTTSSTASAVVSVPQADLGLTLSADRATPDLGDTVTLTLNVGNAGPHNDGGVKVLEALPPGLSFVSAAADQGAYDPATGVWTVGTVPAGVTRALRVRARVSAPGAVTASASVVSTDHADPNPSNNTASTTLTPTRADLALTQTVDNTTPDVAGTVTFTLTATNQGPDAATDVTVSDPLPPGLVLVSATPARGTYSGGAGGLWNLRTLASGASTTLTVVARVEGSAPQSVRAVVSGRDQYDPDPSNDAATASVTPRASGLGLTNTVDNPAPNVGDTVTFVAALVNNGPDAVSSVSVNDLLPAGLTFISSAPGQGSYNASTGTWTVGSLAAGARTTLTLQARVAAPAPATDTAYVSAASSADPDPSDNSASATVAPRRADLALTDAVDNPTPNVGDVVALTVTLTNNGTAAATGVTINAPLPAGLTYRSDTPGLGSYDPATGVWTVGTLAGGAQTTLTLRATVTTAGTVVDRATVATSDVFDPVAGNNTAAAVVNPGAPAAADVALSLGVDDAASNVGDVVTFTVSANDLGPDRATGVSIADPLPAGLTFVSASASRGTYDPAAGVWTLGTLDPGAPQTLTVRARVVSPSAQTASASVAASSPSDPAAGNNAASVTVTPGSADLSLTNTVDSATTDVGRVVTFTVTVHNAGPDIATGVSVSDALPPGLSFVEARPSVGTFDPAAGVWTVGTVDPGSSLSLTLRAVVTTPGPLTSTATVSRSDVADPQPANNVAPVTVTTKAADLGLTESVDAAKPNVGDTVTFTLTLSNMGPSAASGVQVASPLPAGLTFVGATASQGGYDPVSGLWTVGNVAPGSPLTLQIRARVDAGSALASTSSVATSDTYDPRTANNTASASVSPARADLGLTETVDNPTPNLGDTVTFTVTVANNGPDAASGVVVRSPLPSGVDLISVTPGQGTYDPSTGLWTVGTLGNGATSTIRIVARVVSPETVRGGASVEAAAQYDPVASNNAAGVTVITQRADQGITAAVDNARPNVGDTVTFTFVATNTGPFPTTSTFVTAPLPAGLSFVSSTADQGAYDPATGVWAVGRLDTTATRTLRVTARLTAGDPLSVHATIQSPDQVDPAPANNSAAVNLTPPVSDLALAVTSNRPRAGLGDPVTFTVTLSNSGPDPATGVVVAAPVPAGFTLSSVSLAQGVYDAASGTWTVGTVSTSAPLTLTLTGSLASLSSVTETASVQRLGPVDPNPANDTASATVTPSRADLALAASVDNARPKVGDTVTFTVTLTNNGADGASGVVIADALPGGLSFVGSTATGGAYDPATGRWTVGAVPASTARTLTITARVTGANPTTDTASVRSTNQVDPSQANDSAPWPLPSPTSCPRSSPSSRPTRRRTPTTRPRGSGRPGTFPPGPPARWPSRPGCRTRGRTPTPRRRRPPPRSTPTRRTTPPRSP